MFTSVSDCLCRLKRLKELTKKLQFWNAGKSSQYLGEVWTSRSRLQEQNAMSLGTVCSWTAFDWRVILFYNLFVSLFSINLFHTETAYGHRARTKLQLNSLECWNSTFSRPDALPDSNQQCKSVEHGSQKKLNFCSIIHCVINPQPAGHPQTVT